MSANTDRPIINPDLKIIEAAEHLMNKAPAPTSSHDEVEAICQDLTDGFRPDSLPARSAALIRKQADLLAERAASIAYQNQRIVTLMAAPVAPVASEEVEEVCSEAETWAKVKSGSQAALLKAVALLRKQATQIAELAALTVARAEDIQARDAQIAELQDEAIAGKEASPADSAATDRPGTE